MKVLPTVVSDRSYVAFIMVGESVEHQTRVRLLYVLFEYTLLFIIVPYPNSSLGYVLFQYVIFIVNFVSAVSFKW